MMLSQQNDYHFLSRILCVQGMDVAANEVHCMRLCDVRLFNDIVNSLFAAKINLKKLILQFHSEWRLAEWGSERRTIYSVVQCNGDFLQPWKPLQPNE